MSGFSWFSGSCLIQDIVEVGVSLEWLVRAGHWSSQWWADCCARAWGDWIHWDELGRATPSISSSAMWFWELHWSSHLPSKVQNECWGHDIPRQSTFGSAQSLAGLPRMAIWASLLMSVALGPWSFECEFSSAIYLDSCFLTGGMLCSLLDLGQAYYSVPFL